jgi:hypothetical protein
MPSEGPQRQIFLVALQDFSARCVAPDLLADCPFSVDVPSGGRGCGEECEELLDRYGRPLEAAQKPYLSSDLHIERLRRGEVGDPSSYDDSSRPFDAMETLWRNAGVPLLAHRHSVALLTAVRDAVVSVPSARTPEWDLPRIMEALQVLSRRGYEAEKLIRAGLSTQIVAAIAGAVAVALVLSEDDSTATDELPELSDEAVASWLTLCREVAARSESDELVRQARSAARTPAGEKLSEKATKELLFVVARFQGILRKWIAETSLEELIEWRTPGAQFDASSASAPQESAIDTQDRRILEWIWDRFTTTYLSDWSQSSLQLEWRHYRGVLKSPLPRREMGCRPVDAVELSALVADAKTTSAGRSAASRQMVTTAVGLIKDGHRKAAATLFGAVLKTDLDDGELYNNYGFCLLPDHAHDAYAALEKALQLGYNATVNLVNRVLALHWMGRPAVALELAEAQVSNPTDLDDTPSYLWDFETASDNPTLLSQVSPRAYLIRLAVHIARSTGDTILLARWLRISSDLGIKL